MVACCGNAGGIIFSSLCGRRKKGKGRGREKNTKEGKGKERLL